MTMIPSSARIDFKNIIISNVTRTTYSIILAISTIHWPLECPMVSSDFEVSSIEIAVKVSHSRITAVQTSSNSLTNINDISIFDQEKSIFEVRSASTAAWDETCLSLLKSTVAFLHAVFSLTIMVQKSIK